MAKDPACGTEVNEKTAKYKSVHMGKTYYFCSSMRKSIFEKNPMTYVGRHSGHSEHGGHFRPCC